MSTTSKLLRKYTPMLAYNGKWTHEHLRPNEAYIISNKWDGQRMMCRGDQLISRGSRQVNNIYIRQMFEFMEHSGLDGELIIPALTGAEISGVCRSKEDPRGAQAWWLVFDDFTTPALPYNMRLDGLLKRTYKSSRIRITQQHNYEAENSAHFEELEQELNTYAMPFEGYMLRRSSSTYKHGRATLREASLFKLTHDAFCEANIINIHPRKTQDGVILPEVGALVCTSDRFNARFSVGTGWSRAQGAAWWKHTKVLGQRIRIAYKECGSVDAPRQPRYAGGIQL